MVKLSVFGVLHVGKEGETKYRGQGGSKIDGEVELKRQVDGSTQTLDLALGLHSSDLGWKLGFCCKYWKTTAAGFA